MTREQGRIAEDTAVVALEAAGYKIMDRNYFARVGEIDIVAREGDTICFIEVKQRAYDTFGGGLEAINKQKIVKVLKSAERYLYNNDLSGQDYRLDAVVILGDGVPQIHKNIYTRGLS